MGICQDDWVEEDTEQVVRESNQEKVGSSCVAPGLGFALFLGVIGQFV